MTFFDSPVGRCEAVKEMVLLDETQAECAREHGCPPDRLCPLAGWFTPVSGLSEEDAATLAPPQPHEEGPPGGARQGAAPSPPAARRGRRRKAA